MALLAIGALNIDAQATSALGLQYRLEPGSTITLEGQDPAPLSGLFHLDANCTVVPDGSCIFTGMTYDFDVEEMALQGAGLELASSGAFDPIELPNASYVAGSREFEFKLLLPDSEVRLSYSFDAELVAQGADFSQHAFLSLRTGPSFDPFLNRVALGDVFPELIAMELILSETIVDFTAPTSIAISEQQMGILTLSALPVPEPSATLLFAFGLVGLAVGRRRPS